MSDLPFFTMPDDTPQQKRSDYAQECLESSLSVLSDTSSFTSNSQLLEEQLISENFRDLNVPPLYCDPSKLEDFSKSISSSKFDNVEHRCNWKCSQENSGNAFNESKHYVPESVHFLKEIQEALCDKNHTSKENQIDNPGVESAESLSAEENTEVVDDDSLQVAFININKVETGDGLYFSCSICYASFKSQSNAILHLQEHGVTTPLKCLRCDKLSQTEFEAKAHRQSHDWVSCKKCGQDILTEKVERHKTECGPTISDTALHSTNSSVGNSSSGEDTDGDRVQPAAKQGRITELYACEDCNECFPDYEELMNHREAQHFGGKEECGLDSFCSYARSTGSLEDTVASIVPALNENDPPKEMKTRMKNPGKAPRNFTCATCGKSFKASKPLREHEVVHTGARDYACEICGKAFGTRANMKIHLATHSDKRPFSCTICNAAFRQKDSLKVHLRKHSGERPFACTVCNMRFDRNFTLKNHLLTHGEEKSFVCVVCGKAFTTRGGLNNHERLHLKDPTQKKARKPPSKPGTGNWICDECGKLYSTRSNLRMHQRSHKPVAITHTCYVCGRVYKHKDSLEVHMRRHTHDRPYPCPTCGRTFYRNWTLKLHILTHTGEKPHKCPVEECEKAFSQSSSLYNHVQTHHKQTDRTKRKSGPDGIACPEEAVANPADTAPNINHTESMINSTQPGSHLQVPPIFADSAVTNLIIPSSMDNPLDTSLTRDLSVKVGVEEIQSSVLDGLDLSSVTPEGALVNRQGTHLNAAPLGDPSALCHSDVSPNLVWENAVLPMDITNIHLPQNEQPPLPHLSQPMDPVFVLQDSIPLLVSVDGQLYQQDNVKMAALPNFVSQLQ